jgi:hypothetical protein
MLPEPTPIKLKGSSSEYDRQLSEEEETILMISESKQPKSSAFRTNDPSFEAIKVSDSPLHAASMMAPEEFEFDISLALINDTFD